MTTGEDSGRARPLTKLARQRAATREKLLAATLELLPTVGVKSLSLDAIAAKVGMTKGAIYASFSSKDALIQEALSLRGESRPADIDWPKGRHGPVEDRMRRLAEAVLRARGGAEAVSASAEYMLYALRSPDVRASVSVDTAYSLRVMEARVLELFAPEELAMPSAAMALNLASLIPGLMYLDAFGAVEEEKVFAIFQGLLARPQRPG